VVKCPAVQLVHDGLPVEPWYCPLLHVSQSESPCALYMPAGHSLQCVAPVATPVPSMSELEVVVKCPAAQLAHVVSAVVEHAVVAYWPEPHVEHCEHIVLPPPAHGELVYWPAPHEVHGEQAAAAEATHGVAMYCPVLHTAPHCVHVASHRLSGPRPCSTRLYCRPAATIAFPVPSDAIIVGELRLDVSPCPS
jgi:hypothetical protein